MKSRFRDRHDRLKYLKACEVARRIVEGSRCSSRMGGGFGTGWPTTCTSSTTP